MTVTRYIAKIKNNTGNISFELFGEKLLSDNGTYVSYGISIAFCDISGTVIDSASASDITTSRAEAIALFNKIYINSLMPCHLINVIEDYYGILR